MLVSTAEQNQLASISTVELRVGALSCVEVDALEFCFRSVMAGSVAENAALKIEQVAATAECAQCKATFAVSARWEACPHCGGLGAKILSGDELQVARIAGETRCASGEGADSD